MDRNELIEVIQENWKMVKGENYHSFEELFPVLLHRTLAEGIDWRSYANLKENCYGFERYKILKEGHQKMVERFLALYPEKGKSEVKKLVQAIVLDAKYFAKFNQFLNIERQYQAVEKDEEQLLAFLEDFRKNSGIFGMYFMKASLFVMESHLMDVPAMDREIKAFLRNALDLPEENKAVYRELLRLKKELSFTGVELYQALQKASSSHD